MYEEAIAVKAMLAKGLTEDGAAQALGWSRVRVSARMRLLELPQRAQEMVGAGTIALSAVDQLRAIGQVSPALLDAVIDYLSDGNEWAAERLCREPGWVLDAALRHGDGKVFAAHLTHLDAYEIAGLKLGQKTAALLEEAAGLHKQIDRYAYGAPTLRFTEQDVDQARAAGVVIEFDRGVPVIVDRGVYRELAKQAITRSVEQLRVKAAAVAAEKKAGRRTPASVRIRSRRRGARSSASCASSQSRRTASTSISVSACLLMACRSSRVSAFWGSEGEVLEAGVAGDRPELVWASERGK